MRSRCRWRQRTQSQSSTAIAAKAASAASARPAAARAASASSATGGWAKRATRRCGSPSAHHSAAPTRASLISVRRNSTAASGLTSRFSPAAGLMRDRRGTIPFADTASRVCPSVAATAPSAASPATGSSASRPRRPSSIAARIGATSCARAMTPARPRSSSAPSGGRPIAMPSTPPASAPKPATSRETATSPSSRAFSIRRGVAASVRSWPSSSRAPSAMAQRRPGRARKAARAASAKVPSSGGSTAASSAMPSSTCPGTAMK